MRVTRLPLVSILVLASSLGLMACADAPERLHSRFDSSTVSNSGYSQGAGAETNGNGDSIATTSGSGSTTPTPSAPAPTPLPAPSTTPATSKPGTSTPVVTTPNPSLPLPSTIPAPTPTPTPMPSTIPAPTTPLPTADKLCYKADAFICQIEQIIVAETNKLRSNGALTQSMESSFVSRQWSQIQADRGDIGHEGFPAERKKALTAEFPTAKWNFFAENVAMLQNNGTDASKIAKQFIDMWWNSAGHKANMIGNYKNIGVGVAKKGNAYYATQIFH